MYKKYNDIDAFYKSDSKSLNNIKKEYDCLKLYNTNSINNQNDINDQKGQDKKDIRLNKSSKI